jgi:hypothetical protein
LFKSFNIDNFFLNFLFFVEKDLIFLLKKNNVNEKINVTMIEVNKKSMHNKKVIDEITIIAINPAEFSQSNPVTNDVEQEHLLYPIQVPNPLHIDVLLELADIPLQVNNEHESPEYP